jgi:hypothetical protein
MILMSALFLSCTSEITADINDDNSLLSLLFLSKNDPVNVQLVDSINLNVGETIDFYSMLSNDNHKYSNIPVKWSLINNIGNMNVMLAGSKAEFTATNVGVGYIQIEDNGVQKRITLNILAALDNAPVTTNLTPANGTENTQSIITLSYIDADSDLATSCTISSLNNITETQTCSCDGAGVCTVGITGTSNYSGAASFDFTVTTNSNTSNTSTTSLTIDSGSLSCPTGFVAVDGNGTLGTVDF